MNMIDRPWGNYVKMLSPTEFELVAKDWIDSNGGIITSLEAKHDQKLKAPDGEYQIDVVAEFEVFGAKYVTLIECKHHNSPIKREVVQLLNAKVASLGAHKGIVVASVGFQKGAIDYASEHGIALVRVVDGQAEYVIRCMVETFLQDIGLPNVALNHIERRGDKYHTSLLESSNSTSLIQLLEIES